MNIQELIETGKENIRIERALAEERRREAQERERLERERQIAKLHEGLLEGTPEILQPFADLSAVELHPFALERAFPIRIEGCTEIRVRVQRHRGEEHWQLEGYIVYLPAEPLHGDPYEVRWEAQRFAPDDLEKVLGVAALAHECAQEMQAKLDLDRRAQEAEYDAFERELADAEMEREMEQAYELKERNEHLGQLTRILRDDPLSMALLEAFIVAREERMEQAQRDAQSAADQAREFERRAWDAEEKARELEKEAKRAERG